jgi:predicted RNase H-like HicB family nuclease
MIDAERYAITVRKVVVDGEELWRATVRELPDLAEFAETREEAFDLALDAIESLKATALEDGKPFPEPIEDEEEYSGRVTLRMPKWVHRAAALRAMDQDVSLNWYIVTMLTASLNESTPAALASPSREASMEGNFFADVMARLNQYSYASHNFGNQALWIFGESKGLHGGTFEPTVDTFQSWRSLLSGRIAQAPEPEAEAASITQSATNFRYGKGTAVKALGRSRGAARRRG